jgi:UDP-GlcNAc:undecaprenyl-phosphate/decaprenyl-phosphate GlcNAc-1-phosphate transferase
VMLTSLHQPLLDQLLMRHAWGPVVVTMIAMAGLVHAMNIIDGLNGLLGGVAVLILAGLGFGAYLSNDGTLTAICLIAGGAVIGFLAFNFPRARLLCGDGGAYFIGFLIAALSVLLVKRNPEISPWFALMLASYPVTETLFSILRRVLSGSRVSESDNAHLHSLVGQYLIARERAGEKIWLGSNAGATLRCLPLALYGLIGGLLFFDVPAVLPWLCFGFFAVYGATFYGFSSRLRNV